jgi:hypothetical protein
MYTIVEHPDGDMCVTKIDVDPEPEPQESILIDPEPFQTICLFMKQITYIILYFIITLIVSGGVGFITYLITHSYVR